MLPRWAPACSDLSWRIEANGHRQSTGFQALVYDQTSRNLIQGPWTLSSSGGAWWLHGTDPRTSTFIQLWRACRLGEWGLSPPPWKVWVCPTDTAPHGVGWPKGRILRACFTCPSAGSESILANRSRCRKLGAPDFENEDRRFDG